MSDSLRVSAWCSCCGRPCHSAFTVGAPQRHLEWSCMCGCQYWKSQAVVMRDAALSNGTFVCCGLLHVRSEGSDSSWRGCGRVSQWACHVHAALAACCANERLRLVGCECVRACACAASTRHCVYCCHISCTGQHSFSPAALAAQQTVNQCHLATVFMRVARAYI